MQSMSGSPYAVVSRELLMLRIGRLPGYLARKLHAKSVCLIIVMADTLDFGLAAIAFFTVLL